MSPNRTTIALSVMVAALLTGLADPTVMAQATEGEQAAVRAIEEMGGGIKRDKTRAGEPVVWVELKGTKATDAELTHLKMLPALETLFLNGTQVTDDGLQELEGHKTLTGLFLDFTAITDAGLARMKGLTSLRYLSLNRTQITDAGLARLDGHKTLAGLDLDFTRVTDAGLARLKGLPSLIRVSLGHTKVTDAGLTHLQGLTALKSIELSRTQVTDAGVLALRQALPRAWIGFDRMARGDPEGEVDFLAYLRRNGIEAERDLTSWSDDWRVVRPATKGYWVRISLLFFPREATAEQMNHELARISLALMLNAPAHLAMSFPSYGATKVPVSGFPNAQQDPTCLRLIDLFKNYRRASAVSRSGLR